MNKCLIRRRTWG